MRKHTLYLRDAGEAAYHVAQSPFGERVLVDSLTLLNNLAFLSEEYQLKYVEALPKRRKKGVLRVTSHLGSLKHCDIYVDRDRAHPHHALYATRQSFVRNCLSHLNPGVTLIIHDVELLNMIGSVRPDVYFTANDDTIFGIPVVIGCKHTDSERVVFCIAEG